MAREKKLFQSWKSVGCIFQMSRTGRMADNDKGWSARGCNDTVILLAHASLVRQRALRVGLAKLDGPDIDEEGEENDWPVTGTALSSDDEAFIARLVQSGAIACGRASARSAAQGMQREQMRHPVLLLHRLCHMTKVCRWVGGNRWTTLSRGAMSVEEEALHQ